MGSSRVTPDRGVDDSASLGPDLVGRLQRLLRRFNLMEPMRSGREGERLAALLLRRKGYRILGRNLRNRFGEIDVVALDPDGRTVVIVEVKASEAGIDTLPPEVHVTPAKQRKLAALAGQLVRQFRLHDRPVRFDVVGVDLSATRPPVMRHHIAAFQSYF